MQVMRDVPENGGFFEPDELSLLQNIFDQICAQGGIVRESEKAEAVAADLIAHYQGGLRGEELFHAVASKKARPEQPPIGMP